MLLVKKNALYVLTTLTCNHFQNNSSLMSRLLYQYYFEIVRRWQWWNVN